MSLAIDTRSLGEQVGHLSLDDLTAVDDALRLVFNLSR
jgi:mRNA-degrading endonuclease toxin of MazEF toxin-antitoxin module